MCKRETKRAKQGEAKKETKEGEAKQISTYAYKNKIEGR
jgi:hypothetical protein